MTLRHIETPAQQVEHDARPAVEPARGERGAARRAGDADEAFDPDTALDQFAVEFAQPLDVRVETGAADASGRLSEALDVILGKRLETDAVGARQQFAHDAAARMADEVEPSPLGQSLDQVKRVLDRALGHAAVLECVDALAVGRGEPLEVGGFSHSPPKLPSEEEAVPWSNTRVGSPEAGSAPPR